jgi:hypothetical protein
MAIAVPLKNRFINPNAVGVTPRLLINKMEPITNHEKNAPYVKNTQNPYPINMRLVNNCLNAP